MREVTLTEKAIMLKALLLLEAKMDKFDEAMPDAMSEFVGQELFAFRSFFFRVIGFPADTYYSIGYDDPNSFCDDNLHSMLYDMVYLVNLEDENDYHLGNENDPTLVVFEEKVLEIESMLVAYEGIE